MTRTRSCIRQRRLARIDGTAKTGDGGLRMYCIQQLDVEAADLFGHAAEYHQFMIQVLPCDPRGSIRWFNTARSAFY